MKQKCFCYNDNINGEDIISSGMFYECRIPNNTQPFIDVYINNLDGYSFVTFYYRKLDKDNRYSFIYEDGSLQFETYFLLMDEYRDMIIDTVVDANKK